MHSLTHALTHSQFGGGYTLTLTLHASHATPAEASHSPPPPPSPGHALLAAVQQVVGEAELVRSSAVEVVIRLPFASSSTFAQLFAELESQGHALGVAHHRVALPSMEEVFLAATSLAAAAQEWGGVGGAGGQQLRAMGRGGGGPHKRGVGVSSSAGAVELAGLDFSLAGARNKLEQHLELAAGAAEAAGYGSALAGVTDGAGGGRGSSGGGDWSIAAGGAELEGSTSRGDSSNVHNGEKAPLLPTNEGPTQKAMGDYEAPSSGRGGGGSSRFDAGAWGHGGSGWAHGVRCLKEMVRKRAYISRRDWKVSLSLPSTRWVLRVLLGN